MAAWVDLRRDIVELFIDAQFIALEHVRRTRLRRAEYVSFMEREGFNHFKPGGSFYAKQRARYTHFQVPVLEPPDDPRLLCGCGYRAHTLSQLRNHSRIRRCPSDSRSSQK